MKSFAIGFALLHLASLCYGAPGSVYVKPRQGLFIIALTTFTGAGPDPAHYFGAFTTTGVVQNITNPLSVSTISITNDSTGVTCDFFGIDGSKTVVSFGETVDVGPPQAQVSAVCETTA